MLRRFLLVCLLAASFTACQTPSEETEARGGQDSLANAAPKDVYLYAWVDNLRIRENPDVESKIITTISEGDSILFLKQKTNFTTKVSLRGEDFDEPWYRVQTSIRQIGWVYGGGVLFKTATGEVENKEVARHEPDSPMDNREFDPDDEYTLKPGKKAGPVTAKTGYSALKAKFGEQNVKIDTLWFAEGMHMMGLVLFPGSKNEMEIVCEDDNYEEPSYVRIQKEGGRWHTEEGIFVGTSGTKLQEINKKGYTFSGFDWDYGGNVLDWNKGELSKYDRKLGITLGSHCHPCGGDYDKFSGDTEVRSDMKDFAMTRAKIEIMTVQL